jgi:hypothetical protein
MNRVLCISFAKTFVYDDGTSGKSLLIMVMIFFAYGYGTF